MSQTKDQTYDPKPAIQYAGIAGLQTGGAGLLVSCVRNALESHNRGAWGVFTRTGGTIAFFGTIGAVFAFTDSVTANIRETDSPLNGAVGGCAAGLVAGVRARSIPTAVISCATMATIIAGFEAAGGNIAGFGYNFDSREQKEERRRNFFKPRLPPREPIPDS